MNRRMTILLILVLIISMCSISACSRLDNRDEYRQDIVEDVVDDTYDNTYDNTYDDIGEDAVIKIVLDRVPGATENDLFELQREYDDGYMHYEGSLYYEGLEYEFEIDGSTGTILEWEIDD